MDAMTKVLRPIRIQLSPRLAGVATAASGDLQPLKRRLASLVHDLLTDLGVDIAYTLLVSVADLQDTHAAILIEDRPCRLTAALTAGTLTDPDDLAVALASALHENRALLVAADLVVRCWREWAASAEAAPPDFGHLLYDLAERGVRLDRARPLATAPSLVPGAFEAALTAVDGPRVRVFVPNGQHDRLYDEHGRARALTGDYATIDALLSMVADGLYYELGLAFRLDRIEADPALAPGELRVQINDLRSPVLPGLRDGEMLVNDTVGRLRLVGLDGREARNPANDNPCSVIHDTPEARQTCRDIGLTTWDEHGYMILLASSIIRREAGALLSVEVTRFLLDRLALAFPTLVSSAREGTDEVLITRILRHLLDEEIGIRNLRAILECLTGYRGTTDVDMQKYITFLVSPGTALAVDAGAPPSRDRALALAECVRAYLKRAISHKYSRGNATLIVYLLDPEIESRLASARPLSEAERARIVEATTGEVTSASTASAAVVLTTPSVRARYREVIRRELPRLAVVSYQDLSPQMNIQPIARIAWS